MKKGNKDPNGSVGFAASIPVGNAWAVMKCFVLYQRHQQGLKDLQSQSLLRFFFLLMK
jgi:hypothetical protein